MHAKLLFSFSHRPRWNVNKLVFYWTRVKSLGVRLPAPVEVGAWAADSRGDHQHHGWVWGAPLCGAPRWAGGRGTRGSRREEALLQVPEARGRRSGLRGLVLLLP